MARGRITPQMLAKLPRERDVISYSPGLDEKGRTAVFKFVLRTGLSDVVFLPPAVAFHIRRAIRAAHRRLGTRDVRRRGEQRPEPQIIRTFLEQQPAIGGDDWDAMAGKTPRLAKGCEIHAFPDAIYLGFMISDDIFQVFRLAPAISFYLPEMIDEAEQTGVLVDLGSADPPSHHRQ